MSDEAPSSRSNTVPWTIVEPWAAPVLIAIAVLIFYAIPMISENAYIHWDAVDVQLPLQRYFANHMMSGHLPHWTPYLFSGYPLLANPEIGAWYPPNWPFFLLRVNLLAIQFELVLNAIIACVGAWLFFRTTVCKSAGSIFGAFAYGLSGFFAGHSSHLTVFAAAAWFPWILWAYRRALDSRPVSGLALGGLAGGCLILAGYLPGAFFAFGGLASYSLASIVRDRSRWRRHLAIAAGILALSLAVASIQLLPAIELIHQSKLARNYSDQTLQVRSVMTLVLADAVGTISMKDSGLITDHYFYAGMFLVPLALIGLRFRRSRYALALIVPAVWYMLGPSALFYRLGNAMPAMQALGPPDIAWFVAAFGLAWLAAAGFHRLFERLPYIGILVVAIFFADLWYWNMYRNPLAFERTSSDRFNESGGRTLAAPQLPLTRFDSAGPVHGAGPLLYPLDLRFETTTGYLVLEPSEYREYAAAIPGNPRLRDGLNVGRYMDPDTGRVEINSSLLPRAYFPRSVVGVGSEAESRQALTQLDPSAQSTVLARNYILRQDPQADYFMVGSGEESYGVHYQTRVPSLLKLSVPWYPGWSARLRGRSLPILRVDHALMGVVVPAGEGVVEFHFESKWFPAGVMILLLTLMGMAVMVWGRALWDRLAMKAV